MSALHFRFERPAFARFGGAPLRRNVVLRVLMGLLGLAVLAVLVFVSVFVGAAMIAGGLLARLWRRRGQAPRAQRRSGGRGIPGRRQGVLTRARMRDVIPAPAAIRVPVRGGGSFPVRRIYCVGRNFADHTREMGATPADPSARGTPVFFLKPADAVVLDGVVPYPPGTGELHHEVELVVALGRDAPAGELSREVAPSLVFGYGVGLDLTRRDLQAAAKARGLPWDTGKAFDASAPLSMLVPAADVGDPAALSISLDVAGERRQHGRLADLVWDVPDILHELSKLYALRAGDLVFMGTPAGVGPLRAGDQWHASLDGVVGMHGRVVAR